METEHAVGSRRDVVGVAGTVIPGMEMSAAEAISFLTLQVMGHEPLLRNILCDKNISNLLIRIS